MITREWGTGDGGGGGGGCVVLRFRQGRVTSVKPECAREKLMRGRPLILAKMRSG